MICLWGVVDVQDSAPRVIDSEGVRDPLDSYFECITACSWVGGEDIECVTRCVEIHLKDEA